MKSVRMEAPRKAPLLRRAGNDGEGNLIGNCALSTIPHSYKRLSPELKYLRCKSARPHSTASRTQRNEIIRVCWPGHFVPSSEFFVLYNQIIMLHCFTSSDSDRGCRGGQQQRCMLLVADLLSSPTPILNKQVTEVAMAMAGRRDHTYVKCDHSDYTEIIAHCISFDTNKMTRVTAVPPLTLGMALMSAVGLLWMLTMRKSKKPAGWYDSLPTYRLVNHKGMEAGLE